MIVNCPGVLVPEARFTVNVPLAPNVKSSYDLRLITPPSLLNVTVSLIVAEVLVKYTVIAADEPPLAEFCNVPNTGFPPLVITILPSELLSVPLVDNVNPVPVYAPVPSVLLSALTVRVLLAATVGAFTNVNPSTALKLILPVESSALIVGTGEPAAAVSVPLDVIDIPLDPPYIVTPEF